MKLIKINKSEIFDTLGIALLLLASFYFYKFSYFAVPSIKFIIIENFKIFILLFLCTLIYLKLINNRFKNFFLFIFLTFVSIFLLKLIFNISGNLSLHFFLKIIYSKIFNFGIEKKIPLYVKILSYLTPYILIILCLGLLNKNLEKVKKFYVIFGFFLSLIILWDLTKIYNKQKIEKEALVSSSIINKVNNEKKVLWVLFDALDPEYIDKKVNNKNIYRTYNYLKDNGVYHNNMIPPSNWTLYSMPAQMIGENIKQMIPKHDTMILKNLDNKSIPFTFENTIFGKLNKHNLSVSLLSSVLEYCTAYLVSSFWNECEDINSKNLNNSIFKDSLRFYFGFLFKLRIYLNEFGILEFKDDNSNNKKVPINFKKVTLSDLDYDKIYSMPFDTNFKADHNDLINIKKIMNFIKKSNLTFVHIYNPHILKDSHFHIEQKLLINYENDAYFLKYLYTDLFTKKLIEEIQKEHSKDFMIIISSDHWRKDKFDGPGKSKYYEKSQTTKNFVGNSFFLAKILNDNDNYLLEKPSNSILIPDLIEKYFLQEVNSNNDIFKYINSLNVKIHTLIK